MSIHDPVDAAVPAVRRAEAALDAGELDLALRLSDEVLQHPHDPDVAAAVRVASLVHAHRGMLHRSADLYRYLGPQRVGADAASAAWVLAGVGDLDAATPLFAAARAHAAPTSVAGGLAQMARGLEQSLTGDGTAALPALVQAVATMLPAGPDAVLHDTPATLAALAALHCGQVDVAESVLSRAVAADLGGGLARARHHLLLAWAAMLRGDLAGAAAVVDEVVASGEADLRDALYVQALRVGIARRNSDLPALERAWTEARGILPGHAIDLFSLLPLGELAVAAARLRDDHRIRTHLDEADALLDRLGQPPLWSAALHWYGVHGAILAERPADLIPHADALVTAARRSRHAGILASAGQVWLRILQDDVTTEAVAQAVRALDGIGLPWDASRLAAQAAARTTDRGAMLELLQLARSVQRFSAPGPTPAASPVPATAPADGLLSTRLTEREWEVAHLVLEGAGYREIGERLFISPKTVEHHVARIRRRLGARSRQEMLETLRRLAAADD